MGAGSWLTRFEVPSSAFTTNVLFVRRDDGHYSDDLLAWLADERTPRTAADDYIARGAFAEAARCATALAPSAPSPGGAPDLQVAALAEHVTEAIRRWWGEHERVRSELRAEIANLTAQGCGDEKLQDAHAMVGDIPARPLVLEGDAIAVVEAFAREAGEIPDVHTVSEAIELAWLAIDVCRDEVARLRAEREERLKALTATARELGGQVAFDLDGQRQHDGVALMNTLKSALAAEHLVKAEDIIDELHNLLAGREVDLSLVDRPITHSILPALVTSSEAAPRDPVRREKRPASVAEVGDDGWDVAFDSPPGHEWRRERLAELKDALSAWESSGGPADRREARRLRGNGPRRSIEARLALLSGDAEQATLAFIHAFRWVQSPPVDLPLVARWREHCAAGFLLAVVWRGLTREEQEGLLQPERGVIFFEGQPVARLVARIEQLEWMPHLALAVCDLAEAARAFVREHLRPILSARPLGLVDFAEALADHLPRRPRVALGALAEIFDVVDPMLRERGLELAERLGESSSDVLAETLDEYQRLLREAAAASQLAELVANAISAVIRWQHGGRAGKEKLSTTLITREISLREKARVVLLLTYSAGVAPLWSVETTLRFEAGRMGDVMANDMLGVPPILPRIKPGETHEITAPILRFDGEVLRAHHLAAFYIARGDGGARSAIESRGERSSISLRRAPAGSGTAPRNPYLVGLPLKSSIHGRDAETEQVRRSLMGKAQDNAVLVVGERRIGKTTLLNKLMADKEIGHHYAFRVRVDLQNISLTQSAADLYIEHFIAEIDRTVAGSPALERSEFERAPHQAFKRYMRDLDESLVGRDKRLLIVVDELERLLVVIEREPMHGLSDEVMGTLRAVIQDSHAIGFVLCGLTDVIHRHATRYENRLFKLAREVTMPPLDEVTCRELIKAPAADHYEVTTAAVERIVWGTGCQPYLLQSVCWELFDHMTTTRLQIATAEDVEQVLRERVLCQAWPFDHLMETFSAPEDLRLVKAIAARQVRDVYVRVEDIYRHIARTASGADWSDERLVRHLEDLSARAPSLVKRSPSHSRRYLITASLFARRLRFIDESSRSIFAGGMR